MGKTIIFDFDGVIHSNDSGWQGIDVIQDEPIMEVVEVIKALRQQGYEVIVVSTRCSEPEGISAINDYLSKHDIVVDGVQATKPPALVTVDDRCICYRDGMDLLNAIVSFKPGKLDEDMEPEENDKEEDIYAGYDEYDEKDKKQVISDPWAGRFEEMRCQTCVNFCPKGNVVSMIKGQFGRCRRNAPTMKGFSIVWGKDWCGEHRLDENKI